jgi:HEAT repeat protein
MMAIQTLGRLGADGAVEEVRVALDDEHPRVKAAAALALTRLK